MGFIDYACFLSAMTNTRIRDNSTDDERGYEDVSSELGNEVYIPQSLGATDLSLSALRPTANDTPNQRD
ncbi:hypothetical protein TNCV_4463491 [Trichonephila clavipes]|nr:hypothetical protein TNCV_4463491 [Trichonephila clavipes]